MYKKFLFTLLAFSSFVFSQEKEFQRRSYGYFAGGTEYAAPTISSGYRFNTNHVGLDLSGSVTLPLTKHKDLNQLIPNVNAVLLFYPTKGGLSLGVGTSALHITSYKLSRSLGKKTKNLSSSIDDHLELVELVHEKAHRLTKHARKYNGELNKVGDSLQSFGSPVYGRIGYEWEGSSGKMRFVNVNVGKDYYGAQVGFEF